MCEISIKQIVFLFFLFSSLVFFLRAVMASQVQRYLTYGVDRCERFVVRSANTICEWMDLKYRLTEDDFSTLKKGNTNSNGALLIVFAFELMLPGTLFTLVRLLLSYIFISAMLNIINPTLEEQKVSEKSNTMN